MAVFAAVTRGVFSAPARAWAAAVAATSPLWFVQSQNIRNYSLCLLFAAATLGLALRLRLRVRAGCAWPWASWAGLSLAGALDAAAHFYGLLLFGAVLAALVLGPATPRRLRLALAASGLVVAAGEAAWIHLLVRHTQENFQHLWFRKDPARLAGVVYDVWRSGVGGAARVAVAGLAVVWAGVALLDRRASPAPGEGGAEADRVWLTGVSAFVLAAVYAGGVAVSLLFAPSLSDRNVLTAAPFLWVLLAAGYDGALRRLPGPVGATLALAAAALLVFHAAALERGRFLQRNEPWRESARYVAARPGCAGGPLDVVQPDQFGPDTPFYRMIARRWLFGRYLGPRWPEAASHAPRAFTEAGREPELAARLAVRSRDPASCAVLAWAVHDVDTAQARALLAGIARLPGVDGGRLRLRAFPRVHLKGDRWLSQPAAFVVERAPAAVQATPEPPVAP